MECTGYAYHSLLIALRLRTEDRASLAVRLLADLETADPNPPSPHHGYFHDRVLFMAACQELLDTSTEVERTLRDAQQYFDQVDTWVNTPYPDAAKGAEDLDRMRERFCEQHVVPLPPSIVKNRNDDELLSAYRRGFRLVLHIWAYRGGHGKFPKTLDDLKIRNLRELRTDPFSGRDFVYKNRRATFKLYSVWEDMEDDGGKEDKDRDDLDCVFWPLHD